jgi:glycogen operon protein
VADGSRKDVAWFHPDGHEMTAEHWHDERLATLGWLLNGEHLRGPGPRGEARADQSFLVWFHAGDRPAELVAPDDGWPTAWEVVADTSGAHTTRTEPLPAGQALRVPARTLLVLRTPDRPASKDPDHRAATPGTPGQNS